MTISATAYSPSWPGRAPAISVVIPTCNRAGFLHELVVSLDRQDLSSDDFEVVIADDGSGDDSWVVLREALANASTRLCALRLAQNRGATHARNAAAHRGRGSLLAFTDDDCLPEPGWLTALLEAFADDVAVVQGKTIPDPGSRGAPGPWDHTISIAAATALFETCNVAYRRGSFEEAGGFDERDPFVNRRRIAGVPFGEDAILADHVLAAGGRANFAPHAVVRHRYIPGSFRTFLVRKRQVGAFPGLARRSRTFDDVLWHRYFLSQRSATTTTAMVALAVAASSRRPALLVGAAPWARRLWAESAYRPGRARSVRALQLAIGDAVAFGSLVAGSIRHRRLVL